MSDDYDTDFTIQLDVWEIEYTPQDQYDNQLLWSINITGQLRLHLSGVNQINTYTRDKITTFSIYVSPINTFEVNCLKSWQLLMQEWKYYDFKQVLGSTLILINGFHEYKILIKHSFILIICLNLINQHIGHGSS